jgi:Rieske Fe-S protein
MERRHFFYSFWSLIGGGVLSVLAIIPAVVHILGTALRGEAAEEVWTDLGPVEAFPNDRPAERIITLDVRDGWENKKINQAVFVLPGESEPEVYSSICPHLNCPISFDQQDHRFRCPCHNSFFDETAKVVAGPSPRPMDRLPSKVENGNLFCKWVSYKSGIEHRVEV